jgi:hypothetical protein
MIGTLRIHKSRAHAILGPALTAPFMRDGKSLRIALEQG